MSQHIIPPRTYYIVFAILMALLVATVGGSYLSLGRLHLPVALAIAIAKAVLIVLYFMHVRFSNRLTWVFSGAAFFWLAILIVLGTMDFLSRGWVGIDGK